MVKANGPLQVMCMLAAAVVSRGKQERFGVSCCSKFCTWKHSLLGLLFFSKFMWAFYPWLDYKVLKSWSVVPLCLYSLLLHRTCDCSCQKSPTCGFLYIWAKYYKLGSASRRAPMLKWMEQAPHCLPSGHVLVCGHFCLEFWSKEVVWFFASQHLAPALFPKSPGSDEGQCLLWPIIRRTVWQVAPGRSVLSKLPYLDCSRPGPSWWLRHLSFCFPPDLSQIVLN